MATNIPKSQWISYSAQATDEWSGGIATFSNGDLATAFSVSKSNGASSVIVQRLGKDGAVVWSLDIGADYAPGAGSVLVGADDKVYVTGGTKKGASGESGLNDSDIFAAAVSGSGQKLWYKNYGIGIHEIGSSGVLDANGNILLEGRVSEVNDGYAFIKDVPNFYGAEFTGGWRGFQLRINPVDGSVTKAYTTGSGNSGGGPIAIDRSRNIAFVSGYTFGAVNGVNTVGNGDPNGANTYLIARNENTGAVLWTRMENWMRSNLVCQESENAVYLVNKGKLEKIDSATGQIAWFKTLTDTNYLLAPIKGGGVLLSESESNGTLTIRRFDASGTENGSQTISHTGKLYPRSFVEQGDGTIHISGSTSGTITNLPTGATVPSGKQAGTDSFILQINSAFSVAPKDVTPVIRGNSLYTIVDGPSWTQAEANSVKLGGHLVTINDRLETDYLVDKLEFTKIGLDSVKPKTDPTYDQYWIGLSRKQGDWSWISGDQSTYRYFGPKEPFNGQPVAAMNVFPQGTYSGDWWGAVSGSWVDSVDNDSAGRYGIAETPFVRRGDSAYVIVQGPTWEEAEANAVKLGGHLVTINDQAENEWLAQSFRNANKGYQPYPNDPDEVNNDVYWIGSNKRAQTDKWVWSSGESSSFTNWAVGRPSNFWGSTNEAVEMILEAHPEVITKFQNAEWVSTAGNWSNAPANITRYGIAEIKLAPNNKPTGTPSVTGTLKVGSTLTIDASTIQDADIFTGYTPPFQYSWETSTDGTTWSKLTSADATDNNTTYTLNSADVGKRIRGVVSYLDGYGTQESVASAGSTSILNSVPKFQSTTASNNQVILAFSDAIKVAGGAPLSTNLLSVTVDGQTRRISSAQVDPTNANQLLITLTGSSLQSASSISVAYNAPASGVTSGFLTDSIGTKLDAITNQVINTYTATTNVSKSGIGSAYQNLILTSSATTGYGNAQNNTLTGNDGNNTLNGLEGADTMIGGKGDDTYVVDNIGDIVTEKSNEGIDTVQSSINYTLGANVENLILTGSDNLNGTGNELNNIITGNSGNNRLDGGSGADKLIGGRGDDTYVVDNAGDVVVELTSQGADTVLASVNYTLTDNVENLTLTGTDSLTGTGNTLKNTIIGNSGNNLIDGKGDADTLTGLGGGDTFQFSIKPITFNSNTADHITDFSGSQGDKIQIVKSAFGITDSTASLSVVSGYTQVASALATASLFVYDSSSGELYWNQNGITKGAGFGGIFAVLDNKATLSASNFALV